MRKVPNVLLKTGDRLRLTIDSLAVRPSAVKLGALLIPAGSTLEVTSLHCPGDDRLVEIQWGSERLMMFGLDLIHRARKFKGVAAACLNSSDSNSGLISADAGTI